MNSSNTQQNEIPLIKYLPRPLINPLVRFIKVLSTVLITGALGLESWNIYAALTHHNVPHELNPVFWVDRFALAAHFIEGAIAAAFAGSKNKTPLSYGVYTFFVGTVGLLELFREEAFQED